MSGKTLKVGIVTIQNRFNYGNRLQNYATQYVYENLGFEVSSLISNIKPGFEARLRS